MFTGLVEALGTVVRLIPFGSAVELTVADEKITDDAALGDSIAVNGCCLTAIKIDGSAVTFEAGDETLRRTTLGLLQSGDRVNLERSLKLGDRLGGHLVSGHIDVVGWLDARQDDGDWSTLWFHVPDPWSRQMASKGSVAVDGVSLTLVEVQPDRFSVALIPHTLEHTTLGKLQVGDRVNLETDLLAKYVERQLQFRAPS